VRLFYKQLLLFKNEEIILMELEKKIAIVDDDEADKYLIERYFRENGYVATLYRNGREAIRGLALNTPPVVLIDFVLPDMSGIDVYDQTKHLLYQPIFMSGIMKYVDAKKLADIIPQLTSFNFVQKSTDLLEIYELAEKMHNLEQKICNGELSRDTLTEVNVEKVQ